MSEAHVLRCIRLLCVPTNRVGKLRKPSMAKAGHARKPVESAVGAPEISPVRERGVLQIGATRLPIALPYLRKHLSLLGVAPVMVSTQHRAGVVSL
jgi:hypothetical protein